MADSLEGEGRCGAGNHAFRYSHEEATYGSTSNDVDVSVCSNCGAVARFKKGPIRDT